MDRKEIKYILAYNISIGNGFDTKDKEYENIYKETNTLDALGLDVNEWLNIEQQSTNLNLDLYTQYLGAMQNKNLLLKVALALKAKGLITEDNVDRCEISLIVYSNQDDNYLDQRLINDQIWYEKAYYAIFFKVEDLFEEELKRLNKS